MSFPLSWAEVETEYMQRLGNTYEGSKAYPVRLALGSLIIKEKMGSSDEATVLAITENPYLQYFIGLHEFQVEAPFDSSSMMHFRKRFDADFINHINERIVQKQQETSFNKRSENDLPDQDGGTSSGESSESKGSKKLKHVIKENSCWMPLVHPLTLHIRPMWDY